MKIKTQALVIQVRHSNAILLMILLALGLSLGAPANAQRHPDQTVLAKELANLDRSLERIESDSRFRVFRIEVAENGTRFVPDTEPVFPEDGYPAYGGEFITSGYLYPAGTLTCDTVASICNGVNEDGSPEFPDKVIGTWTCRGWHVNDGGHTLTGAWVATNQIFSFTPSIEEEYGVRTITTDGFEGPESKDIRRAVTGGTGRFAGVRGEQIQKLLGWNPSIGVGFTVKFRLLK